MTSLEVYKSRLSKGLLDFFEKYEASLKELINKLESDNLLLKNFSDAQVTRLMKIEDSCNGPFKLANDLNGIFNLDRNKMKERLAHAKRAFDTDNDVRVAQHLYAVLPIAYHTTLEKLRIYLLFFIDWAKFNIKIENIKGVGEALNPLKLKYPDNKYLKYFDPKTRNAFGHYTFFWEPGGKLKLCKHLFDDNPDEIELAKLMMELSNLSSLINGFYLAYKDKFNLPELDPAMIER